MEEADSGESVRVGTVMLPSYPWLLAGFGAVFALGITEPGPHRRCSESAADRVD